MSTTSKSRSGASFKSVTLITERERAIDCYNDYHSDTVKTIDHLASFNLLMVEEDLGCPLLHY